MKANKLWLLSGLCMIFAVLAVHALDVDGGGVSDLYEEQYNSGPLQANEDADNDGLSNLFESYFGLNPLVSNPGPLQLSQDTPEEVEIAFPAPFGQRFQLERTTDLTGTWSAVGGIFTGNNDVFTYSETITGIEKAFFRVQPLGALDSDNDDLNSWEEHIAGSNPNAADSDGDGMMDGAEQAAGLNPNQFNPEIDPDQDGLTSEEEAALGTNPGVADTDGDGVNDDVDGVPLDGHLKFPRVPETHYAVINLDPNGEGYEAIHLNNKGQVVLRKQEPNFTYNWQLWSQGQLTSIPNTATGGGETYYLNVGNGLSDNGEIAASGTSTGTGTAKWSPVNGLTVLPRYIDPVEEQAEGDPDFYREAAWGERRMAASGTVFGYQGTIGWAWSDFDPLFDYQTGVRWPVSGGGPQLLGEYVLGWEGTLFIPLDENAAGKMVGTSTLYGSSTQPVRAVYYEGSVLTLPISGAANLSGAHSLNGLASPLVAGSESYEEGAVQWTNASLWTKVGGTWVRKKLGPYTAVNTNSELAGTAIKINDRCEVVYQYVSGNEVLGGLWQNGKVVNLTTRVMPDSGFTAFSPVDINNGGMILANATKTGGGTAAVLLLPVEIAFEKVGDNEEIADNKNPVTHEWMPGKGKKIFPDAQAPDDETARNEVLVKVTGVPQGWKVRLKVFDVDDPTPEEFPYVIDVEDTESVKKGTDNRGESCIFESSEAGTVDCTVDANGIARVDGELPQLILPMNPGDNIRVAGIILKSDGTPFDGQTLDDLQVADSTQLGYIPEDSEQGIDGFTGALSPTLTIWRKLHIEVDTMQTWEGEKPAPDRVNAIGASWEADTANQPRITTYLSLESLFSEGTDFYKGGRITSSGITLNIASNTSSSVTVQNPGGTIPLTQSQKDPFLDIFQTYDDDGTGFPNYLPVIPTNVINENIKLKYVPAYIEIEEVDGSLNEDDTITFSLNNDVYNPFTSLDDAQNMDGANRTEYWYHFLVIGYQPGTGEDGDPVAEATLRGVTVGTGFIPLYNCYSAVFLEAIRDPLVNLVGTSSFPQFFQQQLELTIAHEIGHAAGGHDNTEDHNEGGLMQQEPNLSEAEFSPKSVERFRSVTEWQE
jgi:hypothetical protein